MSTRHSTVRVALFVGVVNFNLNDISVYWTLRNGARNKRRIFLAWITSSRPE